VKAKISLIFNPFNSFFSFGKVFNFDEVQCINSSHHLWIMSFVPYLRILHQPLAHEDSLLSFKSSIDFFHYTFKSMIHFGLSFV
jgi:hypothetical protein